MIAAFVRGVEFRRGVNPLRDRLKLDNCVTRAMQDVMKLVRLASNRHLRNCGAPDALVQEIIPEANRTGHGRSCAVATPKTPVNVQRFSIHISRYRSKGLEVHGKTFVTNPDGATSSPPSVRRLAQKH